MIGHDCASVRPRLAPYVDGELGGAEALRVLHHLGECAACSREVHSLRTIGDVLRQSVPADSEPLRLSGLASAVVTRRKAEFAESWYGLLQRAQADWHWLVVGVGSIAATLVSTLGLSFILAFGPTPQRGDSLAALISNSEELAYAFPYSDQESTLMQVDDIGPWSSRASIELASRVVWSESRTEAELVDALLAVVTDNGRPIPFERMNARSRRHAEALLQDINQRRVNAPVPMSLTIGLRQVQVRASTTVTAKGS